MKPTREVPQQGEELNPSRRNDTRQQKLQVERNEERNREPLQDGDDRKIKQGTGETEHLPPLWEVDSVSSDESVGIHDSDEDDEWSTKEYMGMPQVVIDGFTGEPTGMGEYGGGASIEFTEEIKQTVFQRLGRETSTWRESGIEVDSITSGWSDNNIDYHGKEQEYRERDIQVTSDDDISYSSFQNIDLCESLSENEEEDQPKDKKLCDKSTKMKPKQVQSKLPPHPQKKQKPALRKDKKDQSQKYLERSCVRGKQLRLDTIWGTKGGIAKDKIGELVGDNMTPNQSDTLACFLQNANSKE